MLKFTTLFSLLFSFSAFASTNGGGVLKAGMIANLGNGTGNIGRLQIGGTGGGGVLQREAVFHIETRNDLVRIAHGLLIDNQWQIEKIEVLSTDLTSEELSAVEKSKTENTWVELN